ncbi:P-loop containing nucleoside triphosphate hydrolase protein [Glonium stellatum]|uniref:P-loop containing nucleoside triphosphate hydrolase protein n=1 Tax=Glonium stellatum TaxID=574774 RepID=A0A8E2ENN2_9PEZI|nr:P-loop containing nucleoside triphosphate hydrolase protein [Glonium stellatum]
MNGTDIFEEFESVFNQSKFGQEEDDDDCGLQCQISTFDARYNSKGERVILNVGLKKSLDPPKAKGHESALVLTRFYDKDKELEYTELEIRSPYVKAALKEVVPEYHDLNVRTKRVILRDHPKCLFHYREELQAYGCTLENPEAVKHLVFAMRYMYKILQSEIYSYYNLVETTSIPPRIDFLNLWMVFRSGDYMYCKSGDAERVLRFREMTRCKCSIPWCSLSRWSIEGEFIEYDGTNFGYDNAFFNIRPYDGYRALQDLGVVPLQYYPKKESLMAALIARGKKFVGLHGTHYRSYDGIAEILAEDRRTSLIEKIKGRLMIDANAFALARPSHQPYLSSVKRVIRTEDDEHLRLDDNDFLICNSTMPGFLFVEKKWGLFNVEHITDIEYNSNAFNSLLLDEEQKQMILSLVKVHTNEMLSFDDVIKGKGRGMIFLLHGIPGVGKTLTAESVADFCQRPLYAISAGDLGSSPSSVESALGEALQLTTKWNAITLIDEADVFLEQRSTSDIQRNGLVSVFLRVLEYYEGIMFLTTNRIGSFDTAFKSRIHLAIKYPPLSHSSRRDLWKAFIFRAAPESDLEWVNMGSLERLANKELNGRQIKNIVRTAHALAVSQSESMKFSHVNMALRAMEAFETDFAEDTAKRKIQEDVPSGTSKRARRA